MSLFLKTHWAGVLHVLAFGAVFLSPAVKAFLTTNPKYASAGLLVWAEIMRWAQSPNSKGVN